MYFALLRGGECALSLALKDFLRARPSYNKK